MAGAILSSFNSALNSAVTLFSVGIFKRHIRPDTSDKELVKVGQIFGAGLAVVSMLVAPFIMYAPQGLFGYLQMVNGCYSIPILTIILVGMFTKRVPAQAAKIALVFGVVSYFISQFVWKVELHYLHVMAILFVISTALMLIIGYLRPMATPYEQKYTEQVDITPWPYAKLSGFIIVCAAITTYVVFS
jgi:SSS family solute:Na+ symporter